MPRKPALPERVPIHEIPVDIAVLQQKFKKLNMPGALKLVNTLNTMLTHTWNMEKILTRDFGGNPEACAKIDYLCAMQAEELIPQFPLGDIMGSA